MMRRPHVTVVTGANRGIGRAICQWIAENGPPGVVYASSRAGVDLVLSSTQGVHFRYPALDITEPSCIEHVANTISDEEGDVDILLNVAGLNIAKPQTGPRSFSNNQKIMSVNFEGTLQICEAFLPIMKPKGRIVNLSSVASSLQLYREDLQARFRNPKITISDLQAMAAEYQASAKAGTISQDGWVESGYSVSKACINAMTTILARENPDILINACCPGWVATEMGKQVGSQPFKSPLQGARIPLRLAFEDIDGISGRYWANASVADTAAGHVQEW